MPRPGDLPNDIREKVFRDYLKMQGRDKSHSVRQRTEHFLLHERKTIDAEPNSMDFRYDVVPSLQMSMDYQQYPTEHVLENGLPFATFQMTFTYKTFVVGLMKIMQHDNDPKKYETRFYIDIPTHREQLHYPQNDDGMHQPMTEIIPIINAQGITNKVDKREFREAVRMLFHTVMMLDDKNSRVYRDFKERTRQKSGVKPTLNVIRRIAQEIKEQKLDAWMITNSYYFGQDGQREDMSMDFPEVTEGMKKQLRAIAKGVQNEYSVHGITKAYPDFYRAASPPQKILNPLTQKYIKKHGKIADDLRRRHII